MHIHRVNEQEENEFEQPPCKKVKILPVKIVPKPEKGQQRQGFTKCKLHFEQLWRKEEPKTEYVTLPLSYFKQLMMEAQKNREIFDQMSCSSQLLKIKEETELRKENQTHALYKELQTTISSQSTEQENCKTEEKSNGLQLLIELQNNFIFHHPEASEMIKNHYNDDHQNRSYFELWIKKREYLSVDSFQLFQKSLSEPKDMKEAILESYKQLLRNLLFQYYSKHSFCDIVANYPQQADELIELSQKVVRMFMIPRKFYIFSC